MCPKCNKNISFPSVVTIMVLVFFSLLSLDVFAPGKQHQKTMKENSRKSLTEATKKSLILVLEVNELLHKSYFNYDAKSVQKNALELKGAIDYIENEEIKKLLSFSSKKLSDIKASNDRKKNDQIYHQVSIALIYVVNKYDVGKKYNAYSCPMVKKKWIQNSKKLTKDHNPYAPNMPHCGSQDSHY